jgi:hypothetical protein
MRNPRQTCSLPKGPGALHRIEPREVYLVRGYVEEARRDERVRVEMTF